MGTQDSGQSSLEAEIKPPFPTDGWHSSQTEPSPKTLHQQHLQEGLSSVMGPVQVTGTRTDSALPAHRENSPGLLWELTNTLNMTKAFPSMPAKLGTQHEQDVGILTAAFSYLLQFWRTLC